MGIKERRTRQKAALRKKMLNAAAELLVQKGYENLSIRKIAARIEYSPALLYHYFEDKADIVNKLVDESFSIFLQKLEKFPDDVKNDPVKSIEAFLEALIDLGLEYPNHYKAVFMNYLGEQSAGQSFVESPKREEGFVMLVSKIEEGIGKNLLKETDPISTAQVIWSSANGLILSLIAQPDLPAIKKKRIVGAFTGMVLEGIVM